jgi:hypothetical protein
MAHPDTKVKALLKSNAEKKLRGKAKELIVDNDVLTLGDLWRLAGFSKPGLPDANNDPVLGQIKMDDYLSIAEACAQEAKDDGKGDWFYKGGAYSCCCCTACCAVMVLPHDKS